MTEARYATRGGPPQATPQGHALGARVHTSGLDSDPYIIVGVARDHEVRSVGEDPRPYLHLPFSPTLAIGLVVRTASPAETALPMLRQAVWSLGCEPSLAVDRVLDCCTALRIPAYALVVESDAVLRIREAFRRDAAPKPPAGIGIGEAQIPPPSARHSAREKSSWCPPARSGWREWSARRVRRPNP